MNLLSEVKEGAWGIARTVFRGSEPEEFNVEILGVVPGAIGPHQDLIIGKLSGANAERTFVFAGMSGSPVYIGGRLVGAISYSFPFSKEPICGITPIEQMIDSNSGQRANQVAPLGAPARRAVVVRGRSAARALEARRPDRIGLYPLTRWTVAGVSGPLVRSLAASTAREGIRLTSIGPRTLRPATPLVPGGTVTALLAGGDVVVGAVGTVTYVDGPTVLGFGHPFLSAGRSRFLMGDGYVYQTIAAPITGSSYKLAEPGTTQGMIVGDRTDGITGRLGPVEGIAGTATAQNVSRGTTSTVRTTIAPDDRTAPIVAALLQDEPAIRATDGLARGTMSLRVRIASPALKRPFVYRNLYAAEGDVVTLASCAAARIASIIWVSMRSTGLSEAPGS